MHSQSKLRALALSAILATGLTAAAAQTGVSAPTPPAAPSPAASEENIQETREQLLKFLRLSPTLTEVVAADPTLLANQDYVSRSNPELARFLASHPEVGRNPDFYLFADLPQHGGRRSDSLQRRIWSGAPEPRQDSGMHMFMNDIGPFIALIAIGGALMWLIRVLLANRRWGRIFKLQTEVHGKLIEKLGTSEEMLAYMNTDAGKRFLEAAPIPVDFEKDERLPAILSRVLMPLSIGIVLTLLGTGLLILRHSLFHMREPLLVFGMIVLMPGIGFIISAGITWVLATRLGLMPNAPTADLANPYQEKAR